MQPFTASAKGCPTFSRSSIISNSQVWAIVADQGWVFREFAKPTVLSGLITREVHSWNCQ